MKFWQDGHLDNLSYPVTPSFKDLFGPVEASGAPADRTQLL